MESSGNREGNWRTRLDELLAERLAVLPGRAVGVFGAYVPFELLLALGLVLGCAGSGKKKERPRRTVLLTSADDVRVGAEAARSVEVEMGLLDDAELDDLAIAVQVAQGVVTLRGTVPDENDRARAEEVARATPGVVTLENRIEVASPPAQE